MTSQIPQSLIDLERATTREMDPIRQAAQAARKRQEAIAKARASVVTFIASLVDVDEVDIDPFITWHAPFPESPTAAIGILKVPEHSEIQFSLRVADPVYYPYTRQDEAIRTNGNKYLSVEHNAYNGDNWGRALVAAHLQWKRQQATDPGGDNG